MEKIGIERDIWIDAPQERVWDAITDPVQIGKWFAPGVTFKTSGEGVGTRLYVEDPETGAELYTQIVEVYTPPHELITRTVAEPPEIPYTTTWKLASENGGTRLTLIHAGYEADPADVRKEKMQQNGTGFTAMMENIKAHIEGYELPTPGGF
ncbi:SRPBCC domain-containing protein [Phototrophicus methaneseepsis]|uniref:SRPBCC domain-containing protein n=1 Tax=Phototrophicus methaneseepsis TaxID=2710758 RepID=A0A7S8IEZ9_9CHLR|nr:SRPBCC domain-containing protein [Phototrophicus methaneseepsis]QPC84195.1 SRPBCC domain-containing protein [Phototrophicus methaneseepsis]